MDISFGFACVYFVKSWFLFVRFSSAAAVIPSLSVQWKIIPWFNYKWNSVTSLPCHITKPIFGERALNRLALHDHINHWHKGCQVLAQLARCRPSVFVLFLCDCLNAECRSTSSELMANEHFMAKTSSAHTTITANPDNNQTHEKEQDASLHGISQKTER